MYMVQHWRRSHKENVCPILGQLCMTNSIRTNSIMTNSIKGTSTPIGPAIGVASLYKNSFELHVREPKEICE